MKCCLASGLARPVCEWMVMGLCTWVSTLFSAAYELSSLLLLLLQWSLLWSLSFPKDNLMLSCQLTAHVVSHEGTVTIEVMTYISCIFYRIFSNLIRTLFTVPEG